jgi:hypothetical protein
MGAPVVVVIGWRRAHFSPSFDLHTIEYIQPIASRTQQPGKFPIWIQSRLLCCSASPLSVHYVHSRSSPAKFFFVWQIFFFFFFFTLLYTGCIWCIVTTLRNNALHNVYTTSHAQQQRKKLLPSPTRALLFCFFIIFPTSLPHFLTGVEHVLGELLEPESIFIKRQPWSFYFRHIRK